VRQDLISVVNHFEIRVRGRDLTQCKFIKRKAREREKTHHTMKLASRGGE